MKNKSVYLLAILLCFLAVRASAVVTVSGYQYICIVGGTATTTELTASVGGGTWSSSNTGIATVAASGALTAVVTAVATGTVIIHYAVPGEEVEDHIIKVNPDITTSTNARVCSLTTSNLSGWPGGGTWDDGGQTVGTFVEGSVDPDHNSATFTGATSAGVATITYNKAGCPPAMINMTVGLPAINGLDNICQGTRTILSCLTGSSWSSSNPSVAAFLDGAVLSGAYTGISAGTANVTFTYHTGCEKVMPVTVTAYDQIEGSPNVCVGQTTTFTHTTSGGTWYAINPTSPPPPVTVATVGASTGVVTGVNAGTAIISYHISASCAPRKVVSVSASPGEIGGTLSVCEGSTTALSCSPGGGTWSSSNTGVATINSSGVVTGVDAGTTTITYDLGAGCYTTTQLTVNETPTISGPAGVCNGYTMTLTATPGGGTWSSSNAGVATVNSSGVVTGVSSGTVTITYMLSNGCYDTHVVTSGTSVSAISGPSAVCVGQTIALSSSPAGGTWASSTAKATVGTFTGIVTGVSSGSTTITYSIGGTCKATRLTYVDAVPVIGNYTHHVCVGGTSLSFLSGNWSSSNTAAATIDGGGYITAVAVGTTTLTLSSANYGCYDTHEITVHELPELTGTTTICARGAETTITPSETPGNWGPVSGDPAYVTHGTNTPGIVKSSTNGVTGIETVTYRLYNSGACIASINVTVIEAPAAITVTGGGAASTTVGNTKSLSCTTSGGTWSSSNTAIGTVNASTGLVGGISAGNCTITYTLSTECYSTKAFTVTSPRPGAMPGEESAVKGMATYIITPNPSNGDLIIQSTVLTPGNSIIKAKVVNVIGQVVYNDDIGLTNGTGKLSIKDVLTGMYLLHITDEKGATSTFKLVIQN